MHCSYLGANNPGHEPSVLDVIVATAMYSDIVPMTRAAIGEQIGEISSPTVVRGVRLLLEAEMLVEGPEIKDGRQGRPHKLLSKTEDFEEKLGENPHWRRAVELRKLAVELGKNEEETLDYLLQLGRTSITAP